MALTVIPNSFGAGGANLTPSGSGTPTLAGVLQEHKTALDTLNNDTLPLSWWLQRRARAMSVLNYSTIQVDTPLNFNYAQTAPVLSGNAAQDKTKSGVVYSMTN